MKKKIPFEDNKGKVVEIPSNASLEDMIKKHGVIDIRIASKHEPLRDGWFRPVKEKDI